MASMYASMSIEEEDEDYCGGACGGPEDTFREKEEADEAEEAVDSAVVSLSWSTSKSSSSSLDTVKELGFEVGCVGGSLLFVILTAIFATDFVLLYTGFMMVAASGASGMTGIVRNIRCCHVMAAAIAALAFLDFAAVLAFSVASYFLTNVVMSTYHSQVWDHTNKFGFVILGLLFLAWIGTCVALLVKHALHSMNVTKTMKEDDLTELVEDSSV